MSIKSFPDESILQKKTEMLFDNISINVPSGDTRINLINVLKSNEPSYGAFEPFLDVENDIMRAFSITEQMTVKINILGEFSGGATTNRSLTIEFEGTDGNYLVLNRVASTAPYSYTFSLPIMIDEGGNIATNGTAIRLRCFGSSFTINKCLIAITQRVKSNTKIL